MKNNFIFFCFLSFCFADDYYSCINSGKGFDGTQCVDCSKVATASLACKTSGNGFMPKVVANLDFDYSPTDCLQMNGRTPASLLFGFGKNKCVDCSQKSSQDCSSFGIGCNLNQSTNKCTGIANLSGFNSDNTCNYLQAQKVIFDMNSQICFDCQQFKYQTQDSCLAQPECQWTSSGCTRIFIKSTVRGQANCDVLGTSYAFNQSTNKCYECSLLSQANCGLENLCQLSNQKCTKKPQAPPQILPNDYFKCLEYTGYAYDVTQNPAVCIQCSSINSGNGKPCISSTQPKTLGDDIFNIEGNCNQVSYFTFNGQVCVNCYDSNKVCQTNLAVCQLKINNDGTSSCEALQLGKSKFTDYLQCQYFGNYGLNLSNNSCILCTGLVQYQCVQNGCAFKDNQCVTLTTLIAKNEAECFSLGINYGFSFYTNECASCGQYFSEKSCQKQVGCRWTYNKASMTQVCIGRRGSEATNLEDCKHLGSYFHYSKNPVGNSGTHCVNCFTQYMNPCYSPCKSAYNSCSTPLYYSNCYQLGPNYTMGDRGFCISCDSLSSMFCGMYPMCYWYNALETCVKKSDCVETCSSFTSEENCQFYLSSKPSPRIVNCSWRGTQCVETSCTMYQNSQDCEIANNLFCSWNQKTSKCTLSLCSNISNQALCNSFNLALFNNESLCQWNSPQSSCMSISLIECQYWGSQQECQKFSGSFGCFWNIQENKCQFAQSCKTITVDSTCMLFSTQQLNNGNCFWNGSECSSLVTTTPCSQLTNLQQCNEENIAFNLKCQAALNSDNSFNSCQNVPCSSLSQQLCESTYKSICTYSTTCKNKQCLDLNESDCRQYSKQSGLQLYGNYCFWNTSNKCQNVNTNNLSNLSCTEIADEQTCRYYPTRCGWQLSNLKKVCQNMTECSNIITKETCELAQQLYKLNCDFENNKCIPLINPKNCKSIQNSFICNSQFDSCYYDFAENKCQDLICNTTDSCLCQQNKACKFDASESTTCTALPKPPTPTPPNPNPPKPSSQSTSTENGKKPTQITYNFQLACIILVYSLL